MANSDPLAAWLASIPVRWAAGCDERVFAAARESYDSPGRHYHTWHHVLDCVEQLRTFTCRRPRAVFLALVFHDAVYVPGRSDNEAKSAAFALATLSAFAAVPEAECASIERMILATRDHHANHGTLSDDEATMLDIDLSILAAVPTRYADYAREIHDEYCPAVVSEAEYRVGRKAFLDRLAATPHIFLTVAGRRRWEAAARENIGREVAALRRS